MSRMCDALKALENRRPSGIAPVEPAGLAQQIDRRLETIEALFEAEEFLTSPMVAPVLPAPIVPAAVVPVDIVPAQPKTVGAPRKSLERCTLPMAETLGEAYHLLARRLCTQLATNYCNVLLFVTPHRSADAEFSIAQLAQALILQSPGELLLIDGDLRYGMLSSAACTTGPGMIETMLGTAAWPDVIHATTTPRIDFVPAGNSQIPTFERPEFGWGALRPKYRVVLIGLADAGEPETRWLAGRCDAVYLVVSRPNTKRNAAIAAVNELRAAGASVLGCVVTGD